MSVLIGITTLMDYTQWERLEWQAWLTHSGEQVLRLDLGLHKGGRFRCIGDLIHHIFSSELRYSDRLLGRPPRDTSSISSLDIETLFEFGQMSRRTFDEFVLTLPSREWDVPRPLSVMNTTVQITPRKLAVHVLLHEIRHWAQVSTHIRLNGLGSEFHDFLLSPVMGSVNGSHELLRQLKESVSQPSRAGSESRRPAANSPMIGDLREGDNC